MIGRRAAAFAVLALACGCGAPQPPAAGWQGYRAFVQTAAGHEIPFFLELPSNCNIDRAWITNGTERFSAPCQRLGSRLLIDFLVYGTRISAAAETTGNLTGEWSHAGGGFDADRLRFSARPIDRIDARLRFAAPDASRLPMSADSVAGIWRVEFDSHGTGKIVVTAAGDGLLQGTAEIPSEYGDLRFLAGNVHGSSFSVSTFDGASAYLIRGRIESDGRLHGELVSGNGEPDRFVATRSEDFEVVEPLERVRVTSIEKRLDLPPLLTSRYAGKAVIVELFGTWCSNCNDLAPLLVQLYRDHRDEGLEILSLAYELSDDEAYTRARIAAYTAGHGVSWEVQMTSGTPEDLLAVGPAKLSTIGGVPVTIFLNRDRTIRAIYTGFWGPATGASHQRATATFQRLTKEILATRVPSP